MRIAVTGSIATDHLMVFPGRFADQLIPDQLAHVSLSFLVDTLEVRRGGVAANIAFGLGSLGHTPLLVGAVGDDFAEYETWLKAHGVDTGAVRVSGTRRTARFLCLTDQDANQIAAFYAGAMEEARDIDLGQVDLPAAQRPDLVLVCPNDPEAMLRHTADCRRLGLPFAADPSQQLARLGPHQVRDLVDGARWLFTNEYEAALLLERTGWTREGVLWRVGAWVTTLGGDGVRIECADRPTLTVPAVPGLPVADPTGGGDAFRAGFLAGVARGLAVVPAARLGCVLAAQALAAVGSQTYRADRARLLGTAARAYGDDAAAELAPALDRMTTDRGAVDPAPAPDGVRAAPAPALEGAA
ncbi:carbohydrate kinase family protein [Streptomyces sp. NPDC093094]|uniref:carbohydrate kinase family protein n=1 Tax=Streptomyces sp. NPDC093094 TaxID=3366026 RepID=UPI003828550E